MNFSNDDFIRTTEPRHAAACAELWRRLEARGQIYLDSYKGWYAVRDEAFYGEDELSVLPDGRRLAPSGAECEWVEEASYFFRLSAWQDRLIEHYEKNPDAIMPAGKRSEVLSFLRSGLTDLSISRTAYDWGVKVPGDPAHVMYVWFDALTNYLSALGFPEDTPDARLATFWPADVHMVGKDILRFHAVYWPAFLMAADITPPRRVFAHGWWTVEGQKMSKSLGNVIAPGDLVARYGLDQTRYFLLREVPFGNDGDFSHDAMLRRINSELANDWGNLIQRSLSMVQRYFDGVLPPRDGAKADTDLLDAAYFLPETLRTEIDRQAFHKALESIWAVIGAANRYVDAQEPWKLAKTDTARCGAVLATLAEAIRVIAIMTQPFMPQASARVLDALKIAPDARDFEHADAAYALPDGLALDKPEPIFPRHVEEAA